MLRVNQLVGFGVGGRVPFKFRASYNQSGYTFKPVTDAGGQAGDLMVVLAGAWGSVSVPASIAGWTKGSNAVSSINGACIWYRRLDGTETGDVSFLSGTNDRRATALMFTGGGALADGSKNAEATIGGNPSAQTVTVVGVSTPLIVLGGYYAALNPTTASFSPSADGSIEFGSGNGWERFKYKVYNSSPQNTTVDMGEHGEETMLSMYISGG